MRREVELAKELGFNGIRIHQKVEDPRFLYWCDRLGLLVWGEMANAYAFSPAAVARLTHEWLEVLARDYSHPCIVAWVPINESWGVPNLPADPSQRALRANPLPPDQDARSHAASDWQRRLGAPRRRHLLGIHDYTFVGAEFSASATAACGDRAHRWTRWSRSSTSCCSRGTAGAGEPVIISEFGGLSLHPEKGRAGSATARYRTPSACSRSIGNWSTAILASPAVAGFCYTQLTDILQETNGLLTAGREPKVDPERIREVTAGYTDAVPSESTERMRAAASGHIEALPATTSATA